MSAESIHGTAVTFWYPRPDGTRCASFVRDGVKVSVDGEEPTVRAHVAEILAAGLHLREARAAVVGLRDDVARLERRLAVEVPPPSPARIGRGGVVRFRGAELWLLARRDKGWAEFGVLVRDWDDLFRRYNVRVTEHGADDAGPFWRVEPCGEPGR